MRIRSFFTVPTDKSITEQYLWRVLASSICSILLCLSCLVGATWAWYTVSIENPGNEIWIGVPNVELTIDGAEAVSAAAVTGGEHQIQIRYTSQPDDLNERSTLYVTFTISSNGEAISRYKVLNGEDAAFVLYTDTGCELSWTVSWLKPANATEITEESVEAPTAPPTEEPTETGQEDDTEAGQEDDTEAGQEDDTEAGQEDDTEAGQEDDAEASQEDDTEASQEDDAEAGQEDDTEAGQENDAETGSGEPSEGSSGGDPGETETV